jgi:NTE family protein
MGLLRGERFRRLLNDTLGCASFEDCRAPVAISAWRVRRQCTEIFDEGDLASAIHASCCFPGLLQPVRRNSRFYLDGGIADRPALASVMPGARVFHHHLASKSPWRFALPTPQADGMTTLAISGLPRLSPFDLSAGPDAFEKARAITRAALNDSVQAQTTAAVPS